MRRSTSPRRARSSSSGEGLEGDPALAFRRTLGMFATGVTVLTTRVGEQVHGMTANAFMSVSLQPPLVLVSIDRRARMGALLHQGTRFGVSVLEARQTGLSDRFAGRVADELAGGDVRARARDAPRRGCARAPRRAGRALVLGRRPLALPRPGRVRPLRRGASAPLPRRALRAARRGSARLLAAPARAARADPRARRRSASTRTASRSCAWASREPSSCSSSSGSVRVERPGRSLTLGPGELIGEIEVLDPGGGRIADIYAVGSVRCLGDLARGAALGARGRIRARRSRSSRSSRRASARPRDALAPRCSGSASASRSRTPRSSRSPFPRILGDFDVSITSVAWVLTSFNLVLALVAVPAAYVSRRRPREAFAVGRRRLRRSPRSRAVSRRPSTSSSARAACRRSARRSSSRPRSISSRRSRGATRRRCACGSRPASSAPRSARPPAGSSRSSSAGSRSSSRRCR